MKTKTAKQSHIQVTARSSDLPHIPSSWFSSQASLSIGPYALLCWHIGILLPLSFFLCFYNLDNAPIWGSYTAVDEARHIRVAQEMWFSGKWWLPTLDGAPYFLKPPFKIWLTMLFTQVVGESLFSYRFIDACLGIGIIALTYIFAINLFKNLWAGFFSVIFLLGNQAFFFLHGTRSAVQDSMMLFLSSLSLLLAWQMLKKIESEEPIEKKYSLSIGMLLGFSAFTKSLAAYFPFIVLAILTLLNGQLWEILRSHKKHLLILLSCAVLIPACYYIPHFLFSEHAYSGAVGHEILGRFQKGFHNPDHGDYYLQVLRSGFIAPWIPLLLASAYFLCCGIFKKKQEHLFVFVWAASLLALYSYLPSRLIWYISPCYIPFSLMLGFLNFAAAQSLVRGFKSFEARSWKELFPKTILILLCFLFLSFSSIKAAKAIYINVKQVSEANPHLGVEDISQLVLHKVQASKQKILSYEMPQAATNELVYMNMLQPFMERARDEETFEANLKNPKFAFALTSIERAEALIGANKELRFAVLGANTFEQGWLGQQRLEPMVFVSLNQEGLLDSAKLFHTSTYKIEFKDIPKSDLHYGWFEEKWANTALAMQGDLSSLFISADSFLEHARSKFSIKIARDGSHSKRGLDLEIIVNSKAKYLIENVPADFTWYHFSCEPNVLKDGSKNVVQFASKYRDGEKIQKHDRSILVSSVVLKPWAE